MTQQAQGWFRHRHPVSGRGESHDHVHRVYVTADGTRYLGAMLDASVDMHNELVDDDYWVRTQEMAQ